MEHKISTEIFKKAEKLAKKNEFSPKKRILLNHREAFFKKYNEKLQKVFANDWNFKRAI